MRQRLTTKEVVNMARSKLLAYCSLINPRYIRANHIKRIARVLESISDGLAKRVIITIPPRHGKSMLCSQYFPAWYLGNHPNKSIITATYGQELADDFGRKVRDQMISPIYQGVFGTTRLRADTKAVGRMLTTKDGTYIAVGVGGAITGRGGDVILVDDPIKNREEADSQDRLDKVFDWYRSVLYTRLMPGGSIIVIMTRWSENDLVGRLIEQTHENWTVINMPAIGDEGGQECALWPEAYSLEDLYRIKETLSCDGNLYDWHCLYQQDPIPKEGIIIKPEWITSGLADDYAASFMAVDPAISEKETADETAICVLKCGYETPATIYETVTHHGRWTFPDQLKMIHAIYRETSPRPEYVGIEDVAYQRALYQSLKDTGMPVVLLKADRDKVRRTLSITDWLAQGRVKVNTPELKRQLLSFRGKDEKNDLVDAFVHCVRMMRDYSSERFEKRVDRYEGKSWEQVFLMKSFEEEVATNGAEQILFDNSFAEISGEYY